MIKRILKFIAIMFPSIIIYILYEIFLQLNIRGALKIQTRLYFSDYSSILLIFILINMIYILYLSIRKNLIILICILFLAMFFIRIITTINLFNPY